jgi:peptidoglycan/LPS O-acetylase OafA/YrhL
MRQNTALLHPQEPRETIELAGRPNSQHVRNLSHKHRHVSLKDAENDNFWSTSLYAQPPVLTSSRCVHALQQFFARPSVLAVATESSSHPTGLASVLAQPWLYAGGGLGNIAECPLQTCIAGAGTRRDSITFASVCVPFECHANDLAAEDFPASLELAAQAIMLLVNNADDDDDPFELIDHPERTKPRDPNTNMEDDTVWFHTSPEQQRAWAEEYIALQTRIAQLNKFLMTGWTCGSYDVPFHAFPFGLPYLLACAILVGLTLIGTFGGTSTKKRQKESKNNERYNTRQTILLMEAESNDENRLPFFLPSLHHEHENKSGNSSPCAATYPTPEMQSFDSLSIDPSESHLLLNDDIDHGADAASAGNNHVTSSSETAANTNTDTNTVPNTNRRNGAENSTDGFTRPQTLMECWNASYHMHKLITARHDSTACLDGLRVWSILWVILGHVMAIQSSTGGGYSNPIDFLPPGGLTTTFLGQLIFASRFAVDTFLVISGYLVVVVIARKSPTLLNQRRSRLTTYFQLIGLRLLRILPLYLLCLGFYTQVAPHLYLVGEDNDGGGPFWYQWDSLLQPCRDSGWTNLLFINNFLPWEKSNTETCFYHSWYLAVDMQLFVLFGLPVTFFVFLTNPKWGRRVTLALWWTSFLLTAYLAYIRHWSINTFDGLQVARFDVEGYAKPHVRGQAYFAGMYVAMLQLNKTRTYANIERPWKYHVLLWSAILTLGFVTFCTVTGAYGRRPCQYSEAPMLNDCGSLWSPTATFLYTATSRGIWSCCIGIVMMLCFEGKGGWLNRFLSSPVWAPLAQLSFGTYLIHPIVIFIWLLGMRQKNVYSLATFGMSLTSVCCVSFACALVAGLMVEFPVAMVIANNINKRASSRQCLSVLQERLENTPRAHAGGNTSYYCDLLHAPVPLHPPKKETTELLKTSGNDKEIYGSVS